MATVRQALVTRPLEESQELAAALEKRGYQPLVEPLLRILFQDGPMLDPMGVQGLLLTSANGARALAYRLKGDLTQWREMPVWCVGDLTAAAARTAGFSDVRSAQGDVKALAALVAAEARPENGRLLHIAASTVAGDLAGQLGKIGFLVHREILYHAEPATALSPALLDALSQGHIAVALFFSPRTAECFIRLAQSQKIAEHCREIMALALSGNVATALAPLPWRTILIAEQPHQMAMMAALEGG